MQDAADAKSRLVEEGSLLVGELHSLKQHCDRGGHLISTCDGHRREGDSYGYS